MTEGNAQMQTHSLTSPAVLPAISRRPQAGHAGLKTCVLLALGLLAVAALPLLSDLTWADLAEEASDQALAALQLVQAAFTILTL
jgi:hypothetical protein